MACIATTLTLLSVLTGGEWNDVSVTTNSRIVTSMNEQVSAKVEMITDTVRKSETFMVVCGEDLYSATTSALAIVNE
ncbi:MAG: hypothetical protein J5691_00610 [Bacilli bacterium]|nr:hypothetical protein [Bacilli bacterium]